MPAWQEHWFTIRQVAGAFWDFNSLFPAPRPLTPTYLETFLATLREQGYSIFVILGTLPQGSSDQGSGNGAFYTPQQVGAWDPGTHPDARQLLKQARSAMHLPFAWPTPPMSGLAVPRVRPGCLPLWSSARWPWPCLKHLLCTN